MHTKQLHELFAGLERAHGTYKIDNSEDSTRNKVSGRAQTLPEPVTLELWEKHIKGERSLGIVPIRDDGTCSWACLDIDDYGDDVPRQATEFINEHGLPLVVCRSKSGGAHVFVFFKEPLPCSFVRAKLDKVAVAMGYPGVEVFPKQNRIDASKNEIGNWLNMPYFNASSPDCDRYGFDDKHEELAIGEFIKFAKSRALSKDEFTQLTAPEVEHPFEDGPPCLQALSRSGVGEGGRNNAMFQFAVYAKKKYGEDYEDRIHEYNTKYFDPQLSIRELNDTVIKSFDRRDYGGYKCEEQPMASVCNRQECLRRRYGIGGEQREREAAQITQYMGSLRCVLHTNRAGEPILEGMHWLLTFMDVTMQLSTDQLLDPRKFGKKAVEMTRTWPVALPLHQWRQIIQPLLDECQEIHQPYEVSPGAILLTALNRHIEFHGDGESFRDVAAGKVYAKDSFYYVLPDSYYRELEAARGRINRADVWESLKREGVERHETTYRDADGKRCKLVCWRAPAEVFEATPDVEDIAELDTGGTAEF